MSRVRGCPRDTCRRAHHPLRTLTSPAATLLGLSLLGSAGRQASMADRTHGAEARPPARQGYAPVDSSTLLRRMQTHAPNSAQVVGFLTLAISGAVLLLLTGLALTGAVVSLIFLGPLALITSPIWVPVAIALFVLAAFVLSACCFVVVAVAAVAGGTWMYRYFTGRHPVGADRVDYARSRIADTASHVKDYAREYGGYLHSRAKDAAPGA
ncbi:hypothetical protein ABZP36_030673 [Zizania latifolia]